MSVLFAAGRLGLQEGTLRVGNEVVSAETPLFGNSSPLLTDLQVSDNGGWNFGTWKVGETSTPKQLALRNAGNTSIVINQLFLVEGQSEYSMSHTCGESLAPGAICTVTVKFTPTSLGEKVGAFRVRSIDGRIRDVWLLGFGGDGSATGPETSSGRLAVASSLNFGSVVLSMEGTSRLLTFANTGGAPVSVSAPVLSGPDGDAFAVANGCPAVLSPYESCDASVTFAPKRLGQYTAQLDVTTSDESKQKTISLRGIGVDAKPVSKLTAAPSPLDFGDSTLNTPVTKTVTVTNNAAESTRVALSYATNPQSFAVVQGCAGPLAPKASCDLAIEFSAASVDRSTGTLILGGTDGLTVEVPLVANVPVPHIRVDRGGLTFPDTGVNSSSERRSVTISNAGERPLVIDGLAIVPGVAFGQSNNCGEAVPPGASCQVDVVFTPPASGSHAETLTLTPNDPQVPLVELSLAGSGIGGSVTIDSTDFGDVAVGGPVASRTLTVSNPGPAVIDATRFAITGPSAADFSFAHSCPSSLAVGSTCSVDVTFQPTSVAQKTAHLVLNVPGMPAVGASLRGWGADNVLSVFPAKLDFGTVGRDVDVPRKLTIANTGHGALSLSQVSIDGPDAGAFRISTSCSSIPARGSCDMEMTASVADLRAYEAQLELASANGFHASVGLAATGALTARDAMLSVDRSTVDFGQSTLNVPLTAAVNVSNAGPMATTLTAKVGTGAFRVSGCDSVLEAGRSCDLTLTYVAQARGQSADYLELVSSVGQRLVVPLQGSVNAAKLKVSTSALAFGSVPLGEKAAKSLTLSNDGTSPLQLSGISAGSSAEFELANACSPVLAAGDTCSVEVAFTPFGAAERTAYLSILSNDPGTPQVNVLLTGLGQAASGPKQGPRLHVSESSLVFAATSVGMSSGVQSVTLTNTGDEPLSIAGIGTLPSSEFGTSNSCGASLGPQKSCEVSVLFSPTGGGAREASLVIASNDAASPAFVGLSGTGLAGLLRLDPLALDFGTLAVGASATRTLNLKNEGSGGAKILQLSLSGKDVGQFSATNTCGATLLPGSECSVTVSFTATSASEYTAQLAVTTVDGSQYFVSLSGAGVTGSLALAPAALTFGEVQVGSSAAAKELVLVNQGPGPVRLSNLSLQLTGPIQAGYTTQTDCVRHSILPVGAQCSIWVTFSPLVAGDSRAQVNVTSGEGTVISANVSATGVSRPISALTLSPGVLPFGTVQAGEVSAPQALTLTNSSPSPAEVVDIQVAGDGAGAFVVDKACIGTLARSASCEIEVTARPGGAAAYTASLRVTLSDGSIVPSVPVSVTGAEYVPHAVLTASADFLDFGAASPKLPAYKTLTLTNEGPDAIKVLSVEADAPTSFKVLPQCDTQLARGASCEVGLLFTGGAQGAVSSKLTVTSETLQRLQVSLNGTTIPPVSATVVVTPSQLDFGSAAPAAPASRTVQVHNQGPDAVKLRAATSSDPENFAVLPSCLDAIAANGTCDLALQFRGMKNGLNTATLTLVTEAGQSETVSLEGKGPEPKLTLSTTSMALGSTDADARGQEHQLTVGNEGAAPLQIGGFALTGQFAMRSDSCPATLEAGASCSVFVWHVPTSGGVHSGELQIASNDPVQPTARIALTATGLAGQLSADLASLSFGKQSVGSRTALNVTVSNSGSGSVSLRSAAITGAQAEAFILRNSCNEVLAPAAQCQVEVTFSPSQAGGHYATLVLSPSIGAGLMLSLRGDGPEAHASVSHSALTFPTQAVGTTGEAQYLSLVNDGPVPLAVNRIAVSSGRDHFGVNASQCPTTLAVNEGCIIAVALTPATTGDLQGVITIESSSSDGPLLVSLSGSGVAPTASVTPTSLEFGEMFLAKSDSRVLQVKNTSATLPLAVSSVSLPKLNWVSQNNNCSEALAPGDTCDISVVVKPSGAGFHQTTLVVTSAAGRFDVPVSVLGVQVVLGAVLPAEVPLSGGTVRVAGSGFSSRMELQVDGQAAATTVASSSQLSAVLPRHSAGPATLTLVQDGEVLATATNAVTFVQEPSLVSVTPNEGTVTGGWTAALSGSAFHSNLKVFVEGKEATEVAVLDATRATFTVPARAAVADGAVDVSVTTAGGSSTLTRALVYQVPPPELQIHGNGAYGDIAQGARVSSFVTVRNTGDVPAVLSGAAVTGAPSAAFSLGTDGSCMKAGTTTLLPDVACTLEVIASGAVLGFADGELKLSTSVGVEVALPLSSNVVVPDYSLSASNAGVTAVSGNFGPLAAMSEAGQSNPTQSKMVFLLNTGSGATFQITNPTVTLTGADAKHFQISLQRAYSSSSGFRATGTVAADKQSASGAVLDNGAGTYSHLGVQVTYAPEERGAHNAQLAISYNGSNLASLPLYGEADYYNKAALYSGAPKAPATAADGDFGVAGFNELPSASVSIAKTFYLHTTASLGKLLTVSRLRVIGADADAFSVTFGTSSGQDLTVNATQSSPTADIPFVVQFSPSHLGAHSAQLVVQSNSDGSNPITLDLVGIGEHDAKVEVSGGAGVIPVPDVPQTAVGSARNVVVYVRNTGNYGSVTLQGIQVIGSSAFSIVSFGLANGTQTGTATPLATGARYAAPSLTGADASAATGSKDFFVVFRYAPVAAGSHSANVTLWADTPDSPLPPFTLNASAITAAAELSDTANRVTSPQADFGTVAFNGLGDASTASKTAVYHVVNTTAVGTLAVSKMAIVGADAASFLITDFTGKPAGFIPAQSVTSPNMKQGTPSTDLVASVKFTPSRLGTHAAQLLVYHNGMNTSPLVLPLSGTGGWAAPVLSASFTAVQEPNGNLGILGFNGVGSTVNPVSSATYYVYNTSTVGRISVPRLRIVGEDAGAFVISDFTGKPAGYRPTQDVAPTAMTQSSPSSVLKVVVQFTAHRLGVHRAQLLVDHNGTTASPLVLDLAGTGTRDVVMQVSDVPGLTDTPNLAVPDSANGIAVTKAFALRNAGTAGAVTYLGFQVQSDSPFSITQVGLTSRPSLSAVSSTINYASGTKAGTFTRQGADAYSGGYTDLAMVVNFLPMSEGAFSGTIRVFHDGPGGESVFTVTGTARSSTASLSFTTAMDSKSPSGPDAPSTVTAAYDAGFRSPSMAPAIKTAYVRYWTDGLINNSASMVKVTALKLDQASDFTFNGVPVLYNQQGTAVRAVPGQLTDGGKTYLLDVDMGRTETLNWNTYLKVDLRYAPTGSAPSVKSEVLRVISNARNPEAALRLEGKFSPYATFNGPVKSGPGTDGTLDGQTFYSHNCTNCYKTPPLYQSPASKTGGKWYYELQFNSTYGYFSLPASTTAGVSVEATGVGTAWRTSSAVTVTGTPALPADMSNVRLAGTGGTFAIAVDVPGRTYTLYRHNAATNKCDQVGRWTLSQAFATSANRDPTLGYGNVTLGYGNLKCPIPEGYLPLPG
ncbi:IPT/TIG domain protein [compost metagenome]